MLLVIAFKLWKTMLMNFDGLAIWVVQAFQGSQKKNRPKAYLSILSLIGSLILMIILYYKNNHKDLVVEETGK